MNLFYLHLFTPFPSFYLFIYLILIGDGLFIFFPICVLWELNAKSPVLQWAMRSFIFNICKISKNIYYSCKHLLTPPILFPSFLLPSKWINEIPNFNYHVQYDFLFNSFFVPQIQVTYIIFVNTETNLQRKYLR